MPVPWLRILDAVIGVTDLARSRKIRSLAGAQPPPADLSHDIEVGGRPVAGALETRLAGVVVAALKEAFDRDARRIEFEREQATAERERAERILALELQRQAGDREIGRLRLLAGIAMASWVGTLFFFARLLGAGVGARTIVGGGWALLLAAFASAFTAQSKVAGELDALAHGTGAGRRISSGASGVLALWLMVVGLALVGLAVLIG